MSEPNINPTNSNPSRSSSAQPSNGETALGLDCGAVCSSRSRRRVFPSPPDSGRIESKETFLFTARSNGGHGDRPERRCQRYVERIAAVVPVYTVQVKSRVDGQLMSVNYVEGQMVQAGDSLVEIDPRPYQAQLTQAEGQLARDQALLENAHVDFERYQIAYRSNAIPMQQLDTQVATVHQYRRHREARQGQVDTARLQIIYSHITAPISGRVGLRLVDPGNIVHATDTNPLAVITQLQPITVIFSPAEDDLPEIQKQLSQGQKLVVEAYDRAKQEKLATGTLLTMDNQIDPRDRHHQAQGPLFQRG